MRNISCRVTLSLVGLLLVVQGGCAHSKLSRFYVLSAESTMDGNKIQGDRMLGVGPIEFPKYLDRPQIVTRSSGNRLELAEFDRWAEPLEENFARVLVENLSALLSTENIIGFPWKGSAKVGHQIIVTVTRFDAVMGDTVFLNARWAILGPDGQYLIPTRAARITEPVSGTDFDAVAQAASRALDQFARQIATAVRELPG